jgi:putative phosphoserine phosphatase / 1-acylglycerol-3-phosphate O-acyltransferase
MEAPAPSYLVFCDLDHTLLRVNSGRVLALASRRYRILPLKTLISASFNAILYRLKLVSDERMIRRMGEWLWDIPAEKMSQFIREIIQKELLPEIRPQLAAELAKHRDNGAQIFILSSAIEEVCQPFVGKLGLDGMVCTRMERRDGVFTGKTLGPFCFGPEKKNEVIKLSDKQQINLAECWYYADDIQDIPVFEVVGHPVCVNPGKQLARIAEQKGWACLYL